MVDFLITIPGAGKAESLNVAVAGGILMHFLKT
jgi:tRNA G18 (ribose-2'-O)-methylase SpoU